MPDDHQRITVELDVDLTRDRGLWKARLPAGPDVEVNGRSREEALLKAKAMALRAMADQAETEITGAATTFSVRSTTTPQRADGSSSRP